MAHGINFLRLEVIVMESRESLSASRRFSDNVFVSGPLTCVHLGAEHTLTVEAQKRTTNHVTALPANLPSLVT